MSVKPCQAHTESRFAEAMLFDGQPAAAAEVAARVLKRLEAGHGLELSDLSARRVLSLDAPIWRLVDLGVGAGMVGALSEVVSCVSSG